MFLRQYINWHLSGTLILPVLKYGQKNTKEFRETSDDFWRILLNPKKSIERAVINMLLMVSRLKGWSGKKPSLLWGKMSLSKTEWTKPITNWKILKHFTIGKFIKHKTIVFLKSVIDFFSRIRFYSIEVYKNDENSIL